MRHPGQSLGEELDSLIEDRAVPLTLIVAFAVVVPAWECARWYFDVKPSPVLITIVFAAIMPFAVWRLVSVVAQARRIRLGRDGERDVAETLDELRTTGARIFHDVLGAGFNVDHIIVCTQGIFVVETKTLRKPVGRPAEIHVRDGEVYANGRKMERNPIRQVRANANWVRSILSEQIAVQPVILFPGWWVLRNAEKVDGGRVWILAPKRFLKFMDNESRKLKPDAVLNFARQIENRVRGDANAHVTHANRIGGS